MGKDFIWKKNVSFIENHAKENPPQLPSLKLTARPGKWLEDHPFLLGVGLFSWAIYVSFRGGYIVSQNFPGPQPLAVGNLSADFAKIRSAAPWDKTPFRGISCSKQTTPKQKLHKTKVHCKKQVIQMYDLENDWHLFIRLRRTDSWFVCFRGSWNSLSTGGNHKMCNAPISGKTCLNYVLYFLGIQPPQKGLAQIPIKTNKGHQWVPSISIGKLFWNIMYQSELIQGISLPSHMWWGRSSFQISLIWASMWKCLGTLKYLTDLHAKKWAGKIPEKARGVVTETWRCT